MENLYGMTLTRLREICRDEALPAFAAGQIARWLYVRRVQQVDAMTDLSRAAREKLARRFEARLTPPLRTSVSADGTKKYLFGSPDEGFIEAAYIPDGERATLCVSSQVGCRMGCRFCATGRQGLRRSLSTGEILNQILAIPESARLTNIVFMGMGEPLHNLGALMSAITYFHNPKLFNISYRKMTVSTCGLVPGIRSLGELDLGIRLAVSLVSADDETRSRIMRVNRTYPLSELKKALIAFQHTCDKRITLEYCMLGGVNTTPEAAKDLASFTAGLFSVVNLIPWNPIEGMEWRTPDAQEIRAFTSQLDRLRVNYTLRMTKGRGISGACGQLATSSRREPSVSSSRRRP